MRLGTHKYSRLQIYLAAVQSTSYDEMGNYLSPDKPFSRQRAHQLVEAYDIVEPIKEILRMNRAKRAADKCQRGTYCLFFANGCSDTKRYFGSSQNVKSIYGAHLTLLRKGKHYCDELQRDVDKYGIENLLYIIVQYATTKEEMLDQEQELIEESNPDSIYNTNNAVKQD